jgi:ribosomal protein S17
MSTDFGLNTYEKKKNRKSAIIETHLDRKNYAYERQNSKAKLLQTNDEQNKSTNDTVATPA